MNRLASVSKKSAASPAMLRPQSAQLLHLARAHLRSVFAQERKLSKARRAKIQQEVRSQFSRDALLLQLAHGNFLWIACSLGGLLWLEDKELLSLLPRADAAPRLSARAALAGRPLETSGPLRPFQAERMRPVSSARSRDMFVLVWCGAVRCFEIFAVLVEHPSNSVEEELPSNATTTFISHVSWLFHSLLLRS